MGGDRVYLTVYSVLDTDPTVQSYKQVVITAVTFKVPGIWPRGSFTFPFQNITVKSGRYYERIISIFVRKQIGCVNFLIGRSYYMEHP